jgi:DNA-binding NarL/FixJ family response regulator
VSASATVVVVDDHELLATTLVMALTGRGIAAVRLRPDALAGLRDQPAPLGGVLLLDLDLGSGLDGAALVPDLRRAGWRVLLLTGSTDRVRIATAVAAGAAGHLAKSIAFDDLVTAVVHATEGRSLVPDGERARLRGLAESARAENAVLGERWDRLTSRERQIVDRIAAGLRPRAIAEEFVVSVATVRTQVRSILAKLEVNSQLEVAALARRRGDRYQTGDRVK